MVTVLSPDSLPGDSQERFDVFLSFTRTTPGAHEQVARIVRALRSRGLTVFQDTHIDEFSGITDRLLRALAGSTVLLAHYSRQYPKRYACQWELTAAFVAAQRDGDPCRRVLAINPDGPAYTDHLAPVELADARFFDALRTDADYERLARRVEAMVRAVAGPLGAAAPVVDAVRLPEQIQRPRRFTGRYGPMWSIHSGLRAMDFPGVHLPASRPAVVVSGLAGSGKTSLAAQYGFLYRDAYPGGIFWTGPMGGPAARGDGTGVLAQFDGELREIADHTLGLPVAGVEPARLRAMVANHLTRAGERVLWIVDDVPPGLPPEALDELLIPSSVVRTLVTSRAPISGWHAREVRLGGLEPEEAEVLFAESVAETTREERQAIRELVDRCGGHPMVIRAVAAAARHRRGLESPPSLVGYLRSASASVADAVRADLDELDPYATTILRTAAVLAPVPFPPELTLATVVTGRGDERDRLARAADELADRGLLQAIGADWEVHPLVSDAARGDIDLAEVAGPVALQVLGMLDDQVGAHLVAHARRLGERVDVTDAIRLELLRHVTRYYEAHGSVEAAADVMDGVLSIPTATVTDLLDAARLRLACGRYGPAGELAQRALAMADSTDDHHARYRARLLVAQTMDHAGRYDEADLFWSEVRTQGVPAWLAGPDQWRTRLALVVATRLRGRFKEALASAEALVEDAAAEPVNDAALAAKLELARLLPLTGKARTARVMAREVVTHYRDAGMPEHDRLLEAEGIAADASLVLDLTEMDAKPELWHSSERELRQLADRYADTLGPYNAVTLTARVRADRALLSLGQPGNAIAALTGTERLIVDHLGPDHLLLMTTRHAVALAHGQRREFAREAEILRAVLDKRRTRLGPRHPETLECQLELGIALGMTGGGTEAVRLVDEAARELRSATGFTDLAAKATTAQAVLRLPNWVLVTFNHVEQFLGSRKGSES